RSAGAGAHVAVADIDRDRAMAVADEASWRGTECFGMVLDVNDQAAFDTARDVLLRRLGRVDIVMNNVGVVAAGPPEEIPLREWERTMSTNLLSIVRSNATFVPVLLEQGSGHIVNTASAAGLFQYAYERMPYSVSKAAVIALSEALALYLRPRHVGVTCLCPGPVATNLRQQVTFSGAPVRMRPPIKGMTPIDPIAVGEMVVDAILADRFLVLTHPELHDLLVERAEDPEGFLAERIRTIEEG
ncbi:MAG: SDR family NAD(P)-dependent oxidoreductase, partial [Actinomycetota bacterium]|nr:SDR family NAD(P)-dependent oxidoreductase [Actinomycetota bacterium]